MSKVVHLSDEAHARAKDFCKAQGLKMSDWVANLIERALAAGELEDAVPEPVQFPQRETPAVAAPVAAAPAPSETPTSEPGGQADEADGGPGRENLHAFVPKKKVLEKLDDRTQSTDDGLPVYAKPPFWSSAK